MMNPVETVRFLEGNYPSAGLNWESILTCQYRFAFPRPRTIVDVGAHQGMHVAEFLDMGAERVVAFEPIPELAGLLAGKLGCDRLQIHEVALGDHAGRVSFLLDRARPSESGLRPRSDRTASRDLHSIDVEMRTMDEFDLKNIDFIKLDAEGAELMILSGAKATLADSRPLLSIEYGWAGYNSYNYTKRSLLDWASAHRYLVCDLFGSPLQNAEYDACVDRYYWDYFVVPEEAANVRQRLQQNGQSILDNIGRSHIG